MVCGGGGGAARRALELRGVDGWKVEEAGSVGVCGVGLWSGVAGRLTVDTRGRGEP